MNIKYKPYFDFSGGFNDATTQDLLKENEVSVLENMDITEQGALNIRNGAVKINNTSKEKEITRRFEYLVRDTPRILEVYGKKLYRIEQLGDVLVQDINSDKPYFLQQQDVLYCCDGKNIYEIGGKDYFSNVGTVNIKKGDIVQIATDFSATGIIGYFYKALANFGEIDLSSENYNNDVRWIDCTDILGATSSVVRTLKAYQAGQAEVTQISVFGEVVEGGYISINIHGAEYDVNVSTGDSARQVASKISATTFPGYTVTSKQNVVTFVANSIGFREDCYAESYNTGVSLVVNTEVNGEDDDNILNEVRNCTKFTQHTKSGRYVATGNPKDPHAVYFSEPYQLNYFKQFNKLYPTSSEGSAVCMFNLLDSVLIGYKHSWYEYSGLEPAIDGSWKRLAIPMGCASEYSVQTVNYYNFIYLADDGLYSVNANILSQYGVAAQNTSSVRKISDNVENTIKTIVDKSKCTSVYYDGVYYLAYNDIVNKPNNKVLLYYTEKKAFSLYSGIQVNDFLYRSNGDLEFASKNYSMTFDSTKHVDTDVDTGLEKKIDIEVRTSNLVLGDYIAPKFVDKLFLQANIGSDTFDEQVKIILRIDDLTVDIVEFNLTELNEGFVWGTDWGRPWGNYSTHMQNAFIRRKGNRIGLVFTNKGFEELNTNIVLYGFAFSYIPLTPVHPFSNLQFS